VSSRRLVLASASPARLRLLIAAGFSPEVIVSGVDEDHYDALDPAALVLRLAEAKAGTVAERPEAGGAVVIGCDSLLDVDGVAYGKPDSRDHARERLVALRGRSAVLRTGHSVIDTQSGRRASATSSTTVHFGQYKHAELEAFLSTDEPLSVAGAFTLDGRFAPFVDGITGDHGTVIGLSLPTLRSLFAQIELSIVEFWA
jgi:septum formation protein